MEDIEQKMTELTKIYNTFLETNPKVEYCDHKFIYGQESFYANKCPDGLDSVNTMYYQDVLKWIQENKHKYTNWDRITFLDTENLFIFISFTIEKGVASSPVFKFESN